VERRCKRFDVVKPLASRLSARVERPSVLEETLSAFVEQRCKRFDVVEPLASRLSARVERPSVLEETLSVFVERLSVLEETLSVFVEQRCKRFDVVKPLASHPSSRRERLQAIEETLTSLVERRWTGSGDGGPLAPPPSSFARDGQSRPRTPVRLQQLETNAGPPHPQLRRLSQVRVAPARATTSSRGQ